MNNRGFTLVELVIVMGVFIIVMGLTTYTFQTIISSSGQQGKSAESQIEGILGLELLRTDIEHAGFGLPWSFQNFFSGSAASAFSEVDKANSPLLTSGSYWIDSSSFNGKLPTSSSQLTDYAPLPIQCGSVDAATPYMITGNSNTNPGTDYLVIRSALVSINGSAGKFGFVNYTSDSTGNISYIRKHNTTDDFQNNSSQTDRLITLASSFSVDQGDGRALAMNGDSFSYSYSGQIPAANAFKPPGKFKLYLVYSLSDSSDLKMPFNRADYFIRRPTSNMPTACNPGTGILYKYVVGQMRTNGSPNNDYPTMLPLMDCAGDMQIYFELSNNVLATPAAFSLLKASDMRAQLQTVRVYVLAHEGKKDSSYTYPVADASKAVIVGDPNLTSYGKVWSSADMASAFGSDWRNYRWKVYSMTVRPKNLYQ